MTQTLIEKLEALPRWWALVDGKSKLVLDAYAVGEIIEQAKAEKQEPEQCAVCGHQTTYCSDCGTEVWRPKSILSGNADIVAELVKALEDVGAWINNLPAGTKSATAKGLMIDALLAKAKEHLK